MARQIRFTFDGCARTYFGIALLGVLISVLTLGLCYPWALVLTERWKASHTFIDGQQLRFTGTALGLLPRWILWLLLSILTVGVYLLWVAPQLQKWKTEHTEFAEAVTTVIPVMAFMPR